MRLCEVQKENVGKYIEKDVVEVSGLKIFERSACNAERTADDYTTIHLLFRFLFLDSLAMFFHGFDF